MSKSENEIVTSLVKKINLLGEEFKRTKSTEVFQEINKKLKQLTEINERLENGH